MVSVFFGILKEAAIKKIRLSEEHDTVGWYAQPNVPFPLNIDLGTLLANPASDSG